MSGKHNYSRYTHGCRCNACCAAAAAYARQRWADIRAGVIVPRHGTREGYEAGGCRCRECVAAGQEAQRKRKAYGPGPASPRCKLGGCDKPKKALGWCDTHYRQSRRGKTPALPSPAEVRICCIVGCGKPHVAFDLCMGHYRQWRRETTVQPPKPHQQGKRPRCTTPDCDRRPIALGLCRKHYDMNRQVTLHSSPKSLP